MQKILIVEDEPEMARGLKDILEFEGYDATTASNGREALASIRREIPDCIILDVMLPEIRGWQVCEEIRSEKINTPILMLTARSEDYDKIRGLKVGADDYLTKPFSVGELLARLMALLRRSLQYVPSAKTVQVGACSVDVKHFRVQHGKKEHSLSHYEVELFKLLYANVDQPVTRDEILDKI